MTRRRKHNENEKTRIVLEALKGELTINEISSKYNVHPNQIVKWKKTAIEGMPELLKDKRKKVEKLKDIEKERDEYLNKIGELTMDINWLKKKLGPYL
jgi:transposase-like protein